MDVKRVSRRVFSVGFAIEEEKDGDGDGDGDVTEEGESKNEVEVEGGLVAALSLLFNISPSHLELL